jgi:hypothetical protein
MGIGDARHTKIIEVSIRSSQLESFQTMFEEDHADHVRSDYFVFQDGPEEVMLAGFA